MSTSNEQGAAVNNLKNGIFRTITILCGLLAVSCSSVTSLTPVGSRPAALDPADWNGEWRPLSDDLDDPDEPMTFAILKDQPGVIEATEKENGKPDEIVLIHLREHGDALFASLTDPEKEETSRYHWALARRKGGLVLAWLPVPEKFAPLVREGRLPGEVVDENTIRLGELTPSHLDLIVSEKSSLFAWEEPLLFQRVGK